MRNLPADRKRYLLRQNRQLRSSSAIKLPLQSATISHARGSPVKPVIAQNLTGDSGAMKRSSVMSLATGTSQSPNMPSTPTSPLSSSVSSLKDVLKESGVQSQSLSTMEAAPLQPQSTGSLWNSWWNSSGPDSWVSSISKSRSYSNAKDTSSPAFYAEGIRSRRPTDIKLVKHLITLRVHLSTAKVSWVERFLEESKGMDALAGLLASLVGKGGKKRKLTDTEENVTYEIVKCLRVLLNTEVGSFHFQRGDEQTSLIQLLAWFQLVHGMLTTHNPCSVYPSHRIAETTNAHLRASGSDLSPFCNSRSQACPCGVFGLLHCSRRIVSFRRAHRFFTVLTTPW